MRLLAIFLATLLLEGCAIGRDLAEQASVKLAQVIPQPKVVVEQVEPHHLNQAEWRLVTVFDEDGHPIADFAGWNKFSLRQNEVGCLRLYILDIPVFPAEGWYCEPHPVFVGHYYKGLQMAVVPGETPSIRVPNEARPATEHSLVPGASLHVIYWSLNYMATLENVETVGKGCRVALTTKVEGEWQRRRLMQLSGYTVSRIPFGSWPSIVLWCREDGSVIVKYWRSAPTN